MTLHKLILEEDICDEFFLIAIHCSEEEFKIAFMINKVLSLRLKRKNNDLDFSIARHDVSYPIFEYENEFNYTKFNLVANKYKYQEVVPNPKNGLFTNVISEKTVTTYLLPEFKNVDYFLKIYSDFEKVPLRNLISSINEIEHVISAYIIDNKQIKSKSHLIFD
ncbi:MAG: hypothetical protein ACI9SJ_002001 [Flavobacteriaceae bacterium]|jgi:hypothetical protein|uniref:IPExxxVDY family protein n=1 Tax=Candidatus Marifrigoribacter sp. Uisw_064 TaxID=3230970 RepID=UPI003AD9CE0F